MFKKNQRRHYFIDKDFQTKFILKFCTIVISASVLLGVLLFMLSQNSTTVAIENTEVAVKSTADFILPLIIQTLILVTIFTAICATILTLFVSHKIAGPLYRLRREIEKLKEGNLDLNFHIRTGDQLQSLAASLCTMIDSLKENLASLKRELLEVRASLDDLPSAQRQPLEGRLKKVEKILNYFKI